MTRGFHLGPMIPKTKKVGAIAKRYKVGGHGDLTAYQISNLADIHVNTVYRRLASGMSGVDLLKPAGALNGKGKRSGGTFMDDLRTTGNMTMTVAVRLARKFRDNAPSVSWLREEFGMSRASAYRWRKAWVEAAEMDSARHG